MVAHESFWKAFCVTSICGRYIWPERARYSEHGLFFLEVYTIYV